MVILPKSEVRKISTIEKIIKQKFEAKKLPSGIEICEIQLYHLASKIKNTEVNQEIDSYLPAINDVLQGIDREELIKKMVSVEFSRFFNYYKNSRDLNASSTSSREGKKADLQEKVTVQMKMEKYVTSSMLESVMVMIGEL